MRSSSSLTFPFSTARTILSCSTPVAAPGVTTSHSTWRWLLGILDALDSNSATLATAPFGPPVFTNLNTTRYWMVGLKRPTRLDSLAVPCPYRKRHPASWMRYPRHRTGWLMTAYHDDTRCEAVRTGVFTQRGTRPPRSSVLVPWSAAVGATGQITQLGNTDDATRRLAGWRSLSHRMDDRLCAVSVHCGRATDASAIHGSTRSRR